MKRKTIYVTLKSCWVRDPMIATSVSFAPTKFKSFVFFMSLNHRLLKIQQTTDELAHLIPTVSSRFVLIKKYDLFLLKSQFIIS